MPSFGDSAFLILLALLLFGPKRLPVLARQLGKIMGDFRRASNEFRSQMEDELRVSEEAERTKKIAAMEAAAPVAPALEATTPTPAAEPTEAAEAAAIESTPAEHEPAPAPLPIATSGELNLMPPSTGLPIPNTSLGSFVDSIAAAPDHASHSSNGSANGAHHDAPEPESHTHSEPHEPEPEARPWMI